MSRLSVFVSHSSSLQGRVRSIHKRGCSLWKPLQGSSVVQLGPLL